MSALDSLWKGNLAQLEVYWEQVFGILGDTATVLPLVGLGADGAPNAASFTTRRRTSSGLEAVFNWQATDGGPSNWTNGNDYSSVGRWQGIVPYVNFDGTDDEADSDDAAYYTVVAGGAAANEFTIGAWVKPTAVGAGTILSKWNTLTASPDREWVFELDANGYPRLRIYDETNNAEIGREDQTALPAGVWSFVAARYDGGTDAANIDILVNGVETDDANVADEAGFATMVDGATVVGLGHQLNTSGAAATFFNGSIAGGPFGPFLAFGDTEATDAKVKRLYNLGRGAMGLS